MNLIKKEPVGTISVKTDRNGNIENLEFHFPDLDHEELCWNCKKPTKKTKMGFVQCEECSKFDYPCKNCQYAIPRSTYHCNGNDLEDYVSHWFACGIRKYIRKNQCFRIEMCEFDPNSSITGWGYGIEIYKKCFKPKDVK